MCGITGAVTLDPAAALAPEVLRRMTDALAHRGPDDQGSYISEFHPRPGYDPLPGVALGHRRLSVLDVPGSRQPLANEDESVWVVFNGEIYNYRRLRQRLEGGGHRFRTAGDTETLVHLYEDEGPEFARHLEGMFALAIWDAPRRQLVLVRDRLGKKPLYYRLEPRRLLFASELKSLLQVPGVPRELDPNALDEYLAYQYVPHPRSIWQGIQKLPPGHYAVYRDGRLEVRPYWSCFDSWSPGNAGQAGSGGPASEAAAAEQLRHLLEDAVRLRMQSDVPLGAFLSGGIDSGIVAALMQRQSASAVKTFCIGFADPLYDETAAAAATARHLGTDHQAWRVEPQAIDILPRLVRQFDEPFADSSALPTWYLAEHARRQVTVALTGDGGDELFLGYPRYRAVEIAARCDALPRPLRRLSASPLWQRIPSPADRRSRLHRLKKLLAELALPPAERYLAWIAIFNESRRAALYSDEFLESLPDHDPAAFVRGAWERAGRVEPDPVAQAGLTDLATYLPCDLLTKVDMASMAHSLECRQPFLDHRLVEWALALPRRFKYARGRGKRILRTAFGELLPRQVFTRPKRGFGVPLARWFREDLSAYTRETLLESRTTGRGIFQPRGVAEMLEEHASGRAEHGDRLWSLLVLELWMREWMDGPT